MVNTPNRVKRAEPVIARAVSVIVGVFEEGVGRRLTDDELAKFGHKMASEQALMTAELSRVSLGTEKPSGVFLRVKELK